MTPDDGGTRRGDSRLGGLRRALGRPLGARREVVILVPVSLALLVVLAAATLLSYRHAVDVLMEQRRQEALRIARSVAAELAAGGDPTAELSALRRHVPALNAALVADARGRVLALSGEPPAGPPLAPFSAASGAGRVPDLPPEGAAAGPGPELPGVVAAAVPVEGGGGRVVRVDLAVPVLAAQRRSLGVLTAVVVGVGLAVGLLLLLFLRHLLRPFDLLVERARAVQVAGEAGSGEDEIELLVRTFERGVAALARGPEGEGEPSPADDDIAALERTLAASLESGLLLLDHRGEVIALNPVGADLLAVATPAPGTPLAEALEPYPELVELLTDAVRDRRSLQRREITVEPASGHPIALGLTLHPLRRAAGSGEEAGAEVRGYLVLFADLTEARRRAEETRLADSLASLGELAAGVAHELRNSLGTLRGYLTLIERSPGEAGAYLAEVRREADHLERVLEDFLAFARPGSARVEELSLVAVAERAAADPALEAAPVEVHGSGDDRLRGDPQLLERAVRNLLRNAVEAQREAGEWETAVEVRVRRAAGDLVLSVADRGSGVVPEVADRLFQPFATGRPGGVGLGLALAHRIVDLHGGTLALEPRKGGGTRAEMRLPADRVVTEGNDLPPPGDAPALPGPG